MSINQKSPAPFPIYMDLSVNKYMKVCQMPKEKEDLY